MKQAQQAKQSYDTLSQMSKMGENVETSLKEAQTQREDRQQRGDTISLPYKELQQYLPATPSGYTAEEPSGESMKAGRIAFSTASQEFKKGDARLDVSLTDYNGAQDLYQGAAAMFALGLEQGKRRATGAPHPARSRRSERHGKPFTKKDGRAELMLTVGGRFLVKIEADEQKGPGFRAENSPRNSPGETSRHVTGLSLRGGTTKQSVLHAIKSPE